MTLNITALTPAYVVQASDRRMTTDGVPVDDEANKALVLQCDDGLFAITFAGVGKARGTRVDQWLAERLLDDGIPELGIDEAASAIAALATEWFLTFPAAMEKRHLFVLTGWQRRGAAAYPAAWTVSNCLAEDGLRMTGVAHDAFDVHPQAIRAGRTTVAAYGLHQAISRPDRRRLEAALRSARNMDRVEDALVQTIRSAASSPASSGGIGRNCMVVSLTPAGEVRATYCPESAPKLEYGPFFLWYEAGRNLCVGDIKALPGPGQFYRFGQAMLLGRARGAISSSAPAPRDQSEAGFLLRMSESKYKRDPVGDVPLVRMYQAKEGGAR